MSLVLKEVASAGLVVALAMPLLLLLLPLVLVVVQATPTGLEGAPAAAARQAAHVAPRRRPPRGGLVADARTCNVSHCFHSIIVLMMYTSGVIPPAL